MFGFYFFLISICYLSRCTLLHRCDDESGCCEDVTHHCEPSKTQLVELYFHVIRSDIVNNITGGNGVGIERLTFLNHTQCECKPINYMPRSLEPSAPIRLFESSFHHQNHRLYHNHHYNNYPLRNNRHHHHRHQYDSLSNRLNHSNHHHSHHRHPNQKCKHVIKCPQPFDQRFRSSDQRCICDCLRPIGPSLPQSSFSTSNSIVNYSNANNIYQHCLRIKNGTSKLDPFWFECLQTKDCAIPQCIAGHRFHTKELKCLSILHSLQFSTGPQSSHHQHHHQSFDNDVTHSFVSLTSKDGKTYHRIRPNW
ncbi:uncharacterized protein NH340_JMT05100 [Sarcoptes scabiei]|nr:uncharacterized protein NH340_JMT05100 [Sarcoptes scabiei]